MCKVPIGSGSQRGCRANLTNSRPISKSRSALRPSPLGEILLECLGARCGQAHAARRLEGEPAATNDGALIYMTFTGLRDDAHHYCRTLPRFETAASKYAFFNRLLVVGIGEI